MSSRKHKNKFDKGNPVHLRTQDDAFADPKRENKERDEYQKERDRTADSYADRQVAIQESQLTTNRRIAAYTLVLAILTAAGTIVSFRSSQAAQRAADAAKIAADTAHDAYILSRRPYIGVLADAKPRTKDGLGNLDVDIVAKNFGPSVGEDFLFDWSVYIGGSRFDGISVGEAHPAHEDILPNEERKLAGIIGTRYYDSVMLQGSPLDITYVVRYGGGGVSYTKCGHLRLAPDQIGFMQIGSECDPWITRALFAKP